MPFDKRAAKSRNLQNLCVFIPSVRACPCASISVLFLVVINALRDSYDRLGSVGPVVSQQFVRQMDAFGLIAAK